jgi:hypothetical protein
VIWTAEDQEKAIAVVLNKINDVWWTYYSVDLSAPETPLSDSDARATLDAIDSQDGRYYWKGTTRHYAALFPLLHRIFNEHPELALEAFRRIFDMNAVPSDSGAQGTVIDVLNKEERAARYDAYIKSIQDRSCAGRPIIVAEGDSWFQFPGRWFLHVFGLRWVHIDAVKDILDHLIRGQRYCVHSLAAGGDWLIKMLRANDYVEPLSRIEPDVFLISGGGNDLLGDGRVANMTLHKRRVDGLTDRHRELLQTRLEALRGRNVVFDRARFEAGLVFLAKEFISFLNLFLIQYSIFFSNLAHSKLSSMAVVTHGYDFALPTQKSTARLISFRRLVNKMMGSGKWLWLPLEQKRLTDEEKANVVYAMITEFNELLVSLARSPRFPHLYHVDCRGVATSPKDWYDEIHLSSKAFRRAATIFDRCISAALKTPAGVQKVFTVADIAAPAPQATPAIAAAALPRV